MLPEKLTELYRRIDALERRVSGQVRHGTVHEVRPGKVRLRLGGDDAAPFLSPWLPYAQIAGDLKAHIPPSVGQQMTILAPGGDWRQGVAVPMTWSSDNPAPSEDTAENVITFGSWRIELRPDELRINGPKARVQCGDTFLELSEGGMRAFAAGYEFD